MEILTYENSKIDAAREIIKFIEKEIDNENLEKWVEKELYKIIEKLEKKYK
jgi:hypothetical protein